MKMWWLLPRFSYSKSNFVIFISKLNPLKTPFFFLLIAMMLASTARAQTVTCTDFTVTGIAPDDTDSSGYWISMQFDASASTFINYPYIAAVLDCNNDTVAIGSMYYFGQFGQTITDYPVALFGSFSCEPLTAVFIYSDSSMNPDTCLVAIGNQASNHENHSHLKLSLFPNPVQDVFFVNVSSELIGSKYQLIDQMGTLVQEGHLNEGIFELNVCNLANGCYVFSCGITNDYRIQVIKR
jgi:hypothetical protein